jgi:hypothetical protein
MGLATELLLVSAIGVLLWYRPMFKRRSAVQPDTGSKSGHVRMTRNNSSLHENLQWNEDPGFFLRDD